MTYFSRISVAAVLKIDFKGGKYRNMETRYQTLKSEGGRNYSNSSNILKAVSTNCCRLDVSERVESGMTARFWT